MKNYKKFMCSALAALTIFSSSAAISNVTTGKTFTNSITVEAATLTPVDEANRIIANFEKQLAANNKDIAQIDKQLSQTKDKNLIAELKRIKRILQDNNNEIKKAIANVKSQIPKLYFKKYTGNSSSIVDALKAIGAKSDLNYRKGIAKANNIANYTGTAAQNKKMLTLLKQGKLQRHDVALLIPSIPICEVGLIAGNFILG